MNQDRLLTIEEAKELTRLKGVELDRLIVEGKIEVWTTEDGLRIRYGDITAWVEEEMD